LSFEEFAESPRVAEAAAALSRAFVAEQAQDFRSLSERFGAEAEVVAEGDYEVSDYELGRGLIDATLAQPVMLGAGVVRGPEGDTPVALLNERIVAEPEGVKVGETLEVGFGERLRPLRETGVGHDFLARWSDGLPSDVEPAALIVPEPEPQFQPGEKIIQGARFGTVGCRVISREGEPGVTTAGHVVTGVGALARSGPKGILGRVTYCSDPARVPLAAAVADIAVIVPTNRARPGPPSGGLLVSRAAPAQAGDLFTSYGVVSGPQHMQCAGLMNPLFIPSMAGMWGSVYMTTEGLTRSGDSGGMVLSGAGELTGHVVGGSGSFTSWVQDATFQLAQAGAQLAP